MTVDHDDFRISVMMHRIAASDFDADADWPLLVRLVKEAARHVRLDRHAESAPHSKYGGKTWTEDDYETLAADLFCALCDRGNLMAREILSKLGDSAAIASRTRRAAQRFCRSQRARGPRRDLWQALTEALPDFQDLLLDPGHQPPVQSMPSEPFPWKLAREQRTEQMRYVGTDEVREALRILSVHAPAHWTRQGLANYLAEWAEVPQRLEISRDAVGKPEPLHCESVHVGPDSEMRGRELGAQFWSTLAQEDRSVLCKYVIPKYLGETTIKQAAEDLGIPISTLHDRAKKLLDRITDPHAENELLADRRAREAFLATIFACCAENRESHRGREQEGGD